jgi:hypothetical protein
MATTKAPAFSARNPIKLLVRSISRDLNGVYRPERHYMRGPGPKWREKHDPQQQQLDGIDLLSTKPAI